MNYTDIAEIKLSRGGNQLPYLAVQLVAPALFDQAWPRMACERAKNQKRWGWDLLCFLCSPSEPAERLLETVQRAYHLGSQAEQSG